MNEEEMADRLAARKVLSNAVAKEEVDDVSAAIRDALANGEKVRNARFGNFGTRSRPARSGRSPRTGEAISMSASPTFKAGKALKDAANASPGS